MQPYVLLSSTNEFCFSTTISFVEQQQKSMVHSHTDKVMQLSLHSHSDDGDGDDDNDGNALLVTTDSIFKPNYKTKTMNLTDNLKKNTSGVQDMQTQR